MNTYSRALRHIDMKDVKQKHQQKIIEQKIQEEKKKEEEKYIASLMEKKKYDWRKELVDEGMVTSNFYTTGRQSEVDISASIDVPSEFTGDIKSGHNFTEFRSTIISVDYSQYDTVSLDISGGGGAPYWSDNTGGTFLPNVYAYFYAVDSEGDTIATNGDGLGGSPRKFPPFGTLSTIDTLLNFGSNTLTIPSNLKQGHLKLVVYQNANTDPYISGGVTPTTTFNSISLRGKTPINVFVSLDSPEAVSFIRTDPILSNLSPQERRQKLKEMLEASDEYVMKILGLDFPGTGAVPPGEFDPFAQTPPGEAGDTPGVETIDYGTDLTPLSDNPYGTEVGQIAGGSGQTPTGATKFMQDLMKDGFGDSKVRTTVNGVMMTGKPWEIINQIKLTFPGGV